MIFKLSQHRIDFKKEIYLYTLVDEGDISPIVKWIINCLAILLMQQLTTFEPLGPTLTFISFYQRASCLSKENISIVADYFFLTLYRCTPSYTFQKVSWPSLAHSFAKMVAKVLQINSKFCNFFAMATSKQLPGVVLQKG